MSNLAKGIPSI